MLIWSRHTVESSFSNPEVIVRSNRLEQATAIPRAAAVPVLPCALACALACTLALLAATPCLAAVLSFEWGGTIEVVAPGSGGVHGTVVEGVTPFSGWVAYEDTCGVGCIVEQFPPEETNYVFPAGQGAIQGGGGTSFGIESSVAITNDELADAETVAIAAALGLTLSVGQPIDAWSASSESAGEFTPSFVDWDVTYIYATSNPFSDTSFVATAPLGADAIIFQLSQDDGAVFDGIGLVTSIPEAGFGVMLLAGVLGVGLTGRTRARSGR